MAITSRFHIALRVSVVFLLAVSIVQARYARGSRTVDDPYPVATAEDLMRLGESPADYDTHSILTADIDLDPNLPGRKIFETAVIALDADSYNANPVFRGDPFTASPDGSGHRISHVTIGGTDYLGLFGQIGSWAKPSNLSLKAIDVGGEYRVGGLVGGKSGDLGTDDARGWAGLIEDVRIYDDALSQAQVRIIAGTSFGTRLVANAGGTGPSCIRDHTSTAHACERSKATFFERRQQLGRLRPPGAEHIIVSARRLGSHAFAVSVVLCGHGTGRNL